MEIYKTQQSAVVVCCFAAGILCCILFDMLKIIRKNFSLDAVVLSFFDILFWILCTYVIYNAIYISNGGEIRWFELMGTLFGICIYALYIHRYMYKLMNRLTVIVTAFFTRLFGILCIPFGFLHKITKPFKNIICIYKSKIYFHIHRFAKKQVRKAKAVFKATKK